MNVKSSVALHFQPDIPSFPRPSKLGPGPDAFDPSQSKPRPIHLEKSTVPAVLTKPLIKHWKQNKRKRKLRDDKDYPAANWIDIYCSS
mmetsp:Transcript_14781/g.26823  ORF Transcript_14781/g.26823 Transcript_14781/m.26823 type:complete len:88 (-) Transcript_14781:115-378(-)